MTNRYSAGGAFVKDVHRAGVESSDLNGGVVAQPGFLDCASMSTNCAATGLDNSRVIP